MKVLQYVLVVFILWLTVQTNLSAQEKAKEAKMPAGFRGEFLMQLQDVQEKIESLADAVPQEKYGWRPMEGVRSMSEVFMHIAGANYLLPTFVGVKPPEGMSQDMEKTVTDKAKVKEWLKKSFDHIRSAIMNTKDADLENPAEFFGQKTTLRGIYFNAGLHMHEHLGQSIAYARANNVVPPWTAAEQAAEKEKSKK